MTDGEIMREYEKIKITVCGLETLTPSTADAIEVTFMYESVYTNAAIEWSEIQTWLTFDASAGSDVACRKLDLTNIKLYQNTICTGGSWYETSWIELEENPADEFRIKVYNNQLWTT